MAIRRLGRRVAVLAAMSLACTGLAGCSFGGSAACPSWASYSTPTEAAGHATAVIAGHVADKKGTVPMFNTSANVWTVEVDTWLKGTGATKVTVVSPPVSCNSTGDREVDPFETARSYPGVVMFLTKTKSGWQALSPTQGVVESSDGEIPRSW